MTAAATSSTYFLIFQRQTRLVRRVFRFFGAVRAWLSVARQLFGVEHHRDDAFLDFSAAPATCAAHFLSCGLLREQIRLPTEFFGVARHTHDAFLVCSASHAT